MGRSLLVSVLVLFWWAGAGCGDNAASPYAGMKYCQDMAGTFHFQVYVPPWKYRREYRCVDGNFKDCNRWEPTGRYVFVVTDVPYVSYDSEIVDLLSVEFSAGIDAWTALQAKLSEIRADDRAVLQPRDGGGDYAEVTTDSGLSGSDILWTQVREHDGTSFEWYRREVFFDADGGVFHLEMYSVEKLDRPDFDALIESFTPGPAPDGGSHCQCIDDLADPPSPCVE